MESLRPIQRSAWRRQLYRRHRADHRGRAVGAVAGAPRRGNRRPAPCCTRAARPHPVDRCGRRTGESGRHDEVRRNDPAGPCAARRRPVKSADDGSRAHTSHDARGAGSAAREPRGSLPGVARRRALLRAAFGLDRRPQRERRGGRGAARHCGGRHRAPEPSSRHGRCRRSLPAAASSPGLERRAETVDGMGTQARQAPGIEPAAARRDRHDLPASRGATACRSARRALCHHAGCRHPVAARNGAAAGRQDGPPAEPAEVRRRKRRCPRGIRRSAATGCAVAAGRSRGVAVSARLFEREWHRSVLSRSVRRLPGSVQ